MAPPSLPASDRASAAALNEASMVTPDVYGAVVPGLSGFSPQSGTTNDSSLIAPGSPSYGSAGVGGSRSPFKSGTTGGGRFDSPNGDGVDVDVHGTAAEGTDGPEPETRSSASREARAIAFAENLANVIRDPSDVFYRQAEKEDPTRVMLRDFREALLEGDAEDVASATKTSGLSESTRPILHDPQSKKNSYGSTSAVGAGESASSQMTNRSHENLERTNRLGGGSGDTTAASSAATASTPTRKQSERNEHTNPSPGRQSARMRKRAVSRSDQIPIQDKTQSEVFKIKCGRCSVMLKIPREVSVFRCPKCASKLRAPAVETNQVESIGLKKNENTESTEIQAELAVLRDARRALERHVAFSKSLEDVVTELAERVPPAAA